MLVLLVAVLVAVSDQVTKYLVRAGFALGESRPILEGFFSLTYVRNTGAAWGILGGQNAWLTVAADARTLFDTQPEGRMSGALGLLGIDLSRLSEQAGHA